MIRPAHLLVCALALLAPAVASALDRAPVDGTARACPRYGPGFFEVPGTGSCVRISGRATAGVDASSRRRFSRDQIAAPFASGRVAIDSRTDTAYGPVRTFVRVRGGQGGQAVADRAFITVGH